jgi:hypothetical protein
MEKKNFVITRNINGTELSIPLTDVEIYSAYKYQQGLFDEQDVRNLILDMSNDEIKKKYGISKKKFEALIPDMAIEMRRNIDKYDVDWEYAREEAVDFVIQEGIGSH